MFKLTFRVKQEGSISLAGGGESNRTDISQSEERERERERLTFIITDPDLSVDNGSNANIGGRVVCPGDEYQPEVFKSLHNIIL